jgi:hypothetical protein
MHLTNNSENDANPISYHLVFRGEVLPNFTPEQVQQHLAQRLKIHDGKVSKLFSGKSFALKTVKSLKKARKMAVAFANMGAVVSIAKPKYPQKNTQTDAANEPPGIATRDALLTTFPPADRESMAEAHAIEAKNTDLFSTDPQPDQHQHAVIWRHILKYRFDSFMAKGGASIFKALVVVFLAIFLLIAGFRGILFLINPEAALQYGELDLLGNIYITFLQLTDPGNMAQDILSSSWYKLFAILAGLSGVIMLSALIAFITTALDQKISELKRGRSKVIEKGHTLILGWNEQRIIEVIRELILANESGKDACVVILADEDKEEMDDILRLRLPDTKTTRIVTRSGQVTTLANMDMVSIEHCKSVIVLASCGDTSSPDEKSLSDAMVIQTILATAGIEREAEEFAIVAEIFNEAYREIVENTFPEHVVTVNTSDVLAKLLVQTSRSVGLSVVYNEILSYDGCEMYFYKADWGAKKFADLAYHFPDGVPMGIRHADDSLTLNPKLDYAMRDDDEILIIADDDSTIEFLSHPVAQPTSYPAIERRLEQKQEKELILGWNYKAPVIISEFADYVKDGSQIDIMLRDAGDEIRQTIQTLDSEIENIRINLLEKNCLNRSHLLSIEPFNYDNIIILASTGDDLDAQQVDSENIVTLLLLRSIYKEYGMSDAKTKLITEILDSQNYPLVARAGVKDIIISNRLVSMIVAQISESKKIKHVYDDIFQEDGSEVYLKPASLYFDQFPIKASFADLISIAQARCEICIGLKIKDDEANPKMNNGVKLIPDKNKFFTLRPEDSLVVLAEDEL